MKATVEQMWNDWDGTLNRKVALILVGSTGLYSINPFLAIAALFAILLIALYVSETRRREIFGRRDKLMGKHKKNKLSKRQTKVYYQMVGGLAVNRDKRDVWTFRLGYIIWSVMFIYKMIEMVQV